MKVKLFLQALPMVTVIVGRPTTSGMCRVETLTESADEPRYVEFSSNKSELAPGKPKWCNYVKGVAAQMQSKTFFIVFFLSLQIFITYGNSCL